MSARQLNRSISTNQFDRPNTNTITNALRRCVSCNETGDNGTPNQSPATNGNMSGNANSIKYCLLDALAQLAEFVKSYVHYWKLRDVKIVFRYTDAEKRLPKLSTRLARCKLQSLSLVKNILKTMGKNLSNTLTPSSQGEQLLPTFLERAEHAIDNAMLLCNKSDPNFQFEKFDQKDLPQCIDIMSAAKLLQKYLTDVTNNTGQ